jgi:predicted helicase
LSVKIRYSNGQEQLDLIQLAGRELRKILSKQYGYIKSPLAISDASYLTQKGLTGDLYIPLR